MIYGYFPSLYFRILVLVLIFLGGPTTASAELAPEGAFFLQGVGSATVRFGLGCQTGIPGSNVAQINDMDAVIAPPNGAGESVINFFVAWADPGTNGSAAGNFKYDFAADNVTNVGVMIGNGVVSNGIPVEGTGTAPVVPITGFFTADGIDVPNADTVVINNLSFALNISMGCFVDVIMTGTLGRIALGGTEKQPPSEILQAQQLAQLGQMVQTFIPKVVARPGSSEKLASAKFPVHTHDTRRR